MAETMSIARAPCVIKADGLASGKGVFVCHTPEEVDAALVAVAALGEEFVIEELLDGPEVSLFALCDGRRALPIGAAQDFKRIGDGDTGPNTGGMGAYSPVAGIPDVDSLVAQVHQPVLDELARRGSPFIGCLFAGLMLTPEPKVLEFNARFGDPETQVLMARWQGDLVGPLSAAAHGDLGGAPIELSGESAVTVVVAGPDYPASSDYAGAPIAGIDEAEQTGALVFHGGTAMRDGHVVTNGGRILSVTALGNSIREARERAYAATSSRSRAHRRDGTSRRWLVAEPLVGILIGSESDRERLKGATDELDARGIAWELDVRSAHRSPDAVAEYAKGAAGRGIKVLICGAGLAAALPGVVAAHTELPVIGVPLRSSMSVLDGMDALLSIVQMPPGVPVATVGVDNAKNAAVLAARILALLGLP
jgi:phosphoribosylamine--glycine ligase